MDETPIVQESASGGGAPAKKRRRSRFEKVLLIDALCFSVAAGLLLVHFMVSRSGVLAAMAVALLALTAGLAVYEHGPLAFARAAGRAAWAPGFALAAPPPLAIRRSSPSPCRCS